jgi:hypothetical protein
MLSIRFDQDHEWWVAGQTFDRLFRASLDSGVMRADLERWWHTANAGGGLSLEMLDPTEAQALTAALRTTAERELAALGEVDQATPDGSYQVGLRRLLEQLGSG